MNCIIATIFINNEMLNKNKKPTEIMHKHELVHKEFDVFIKCHRLEYFFTQIINAQCRTFI